MQFVFSAIASDEWNGKKVSTTDVRSSLVDVKLYCVLQYYSLLPVVSLRFASRRQTL